MRKRHEPEDIFLDCVKKMITNLLINNPNYENDHYGSCDAARIIIDTKKRSRLILEKIDDWTHLIKPFDDKK